ncbi:hypothetical protein [Bradyrhizobium sp. AUGA SZCCT0431]|uniref:hypothetical protein n=1 Tax=Bradyrhizobium sp. AUGA SZCCT0431 TaxID=2807674 RepID=UPI001BAAA697|nr:hypothetical protein [Bradyrhizobium sp. AUGA SZCCT0431]MBR1146662.1 hypothetical protein [Bradyrhizobium sp. AUGA SZCCT0431]
MTNQTRSLATGRYTTLKTKFIIGTLILGIGLFAFSYFKSEWDNKAITVINPIVATVAHADETPNLEQKIEALKDKLVAEMIACENPSGIPAVYDNNAGGTLNRRDAISYGRLMYKIPTLQGHYKQITGETLTDVEAARFAMDEVEIKKFVIRVWLEIEGSVNHWTCATPAMKRTIEDIRFLTT